MSLLNMIFILFIADHITTQVNTMFDDVIDEFHNLDLIKNRFEEWKYRHSDSYQEAYIGLCLPKLFSPFIKLSLITWNPLEVEFMCTYRAMGQNFPLLVHCESSGPCLLNKLLHNSDTSISSHCIYVVNAVS